MNKAADLVSRFLTGDYYKEVVLGHMTLKMYPPTIKELINIFPRWELSVQETTTRAEIMSKMPENSWQSAGIVSRACIRGQRTGFKRAALQQYIMHYASHEEITNAVMQLSIVIRGDELFKECQLDKTVREKASIILGNNNMMGQVASFIENLHLSYNEVLNEIPYPVLLMMSSDKLRTLSPDEKIIRRMSGQEFMKRRMKNRN